MIGRLIRILFLVGLIILIINRLLNRKQKHSLHEVMVISAWICLMASILALLWYNWIAN